MPTPHVSRRLVMTSALAAMFAPRRGRATTAPVLLRDLYNKDLSFSDQARGLEGRRIPVDGFMAPPLRAESSFFVLTRRPMAVCPFCNNEADWPDDIVAVYTKRRVEVIGLNIPIRVLGTLALGTYRDPDLGFVSRLRLQDATYRRI